ncbi:FkbM family methyltransferase [Chthonobacter albigriseus]|uniref:FkbM family methyltransferase n=1 Tax=Chthonobacter albigriseus TaxID=1683161 RepID=UPI0015EFCEFC|nr:FkbM family methyltransferase [Chthonobacter albigriseus]
MAIRYLPSWAKTLVKDTLAERHQVISSLASHAEVMATIGNLRPIDNGFPLIRVGGEGDGGYLLPVDFDGLGGCFSPGVGKTSAFEKHLIEEYGLQCYLADGSVEGPQIQHERIEFEKKFIGSTRNDKFMTLDSWVDRKFRGRVNEDLILQMDIEGWEYDTLIHLEKSTLRRFRIIALELHGLDRIFLQGCVSMFDSIFRKLTEFHDVVHLHPNNYATIETRVGVEIPPLLEVTLHRKDRAKSRSPRQQFPHVLDRQSTSGPDVVLPRCWYA